MKILKNILVGFLVSFVGSIPLGYLNVVGFEIYREKGFLPTTCFLFGVILVEFFVIYGTLVFANKLADNTKLTQYIKVFSIVFMFFLAFVFYTTATTATNRASVFTHFGYWETFTTGMVLSCLNFMQIPFWTGWNLYLLNGKYIEVSKARKYFYFFGTLLGTFCGMMTLILSLQYFTTTLDFLFHYLLKIIIPLAFLALGIFQAIAFYRKYISKN